MNNDTFQWSDALAQEYHNWDGFEPFGKGSAIEQFKRYKSKNSKKEVIDDFNNAPLGLYEIFWKEGGSSLAAIGNLHDGTRWLAPVNWTSKDYPTGKMTDYFSSIEKMVLIKSNASTPEQPKKERIEVERIQDLTQRNNINRPSLVIDTNIKIPSDKYEAIKLAIERVLNDEDRFPLKVDIGYGTSIISEEDYGKDIRNAELLAFYAGRDRTGGAWNEQIKNWQFHSFEDYLKSKQ